MAEEEVEAADDAVTDEVADEDVPVAEPEVAVLEPVLAVLVGSLSAPKTGRRAKELASARFLIMRESSTWPRAGVTSEFASDTVAKPRATTRQKNVSATLLRANMVACVFNRSKPCRRGRGGVRDAVGAAVSLFRSRVHGC